MFGAHGIRAALFNSALITYITVISRRQVLTMNGSNEHLPAQFGVLGSINDFLLFVILIAQKVA